MLYAIGTKKMRFLTLALLSLSLGATGQGFNSPFYSDTITEISDKCRLEMEKAKADFEKNEFVIELLKPIPFTDTQQRVLLEQFKIQSSYRTGLISPNYDCYNFHLKTLAKLKWGYDIFEKSKTISDSLDDNGYGDQQAKFKFDDKKFDVFLSQNLPAKIKKKVKRIGDHGILQIKVDISESGDADNVKIINSKNFTELEMEIYKLLKGGEFWIPKKDNGRGVKTWMIYPVRIEDI